MNKYWKSMQEKTFNIGAYGPGEKKDDSVTAQSLTALGFVSDDGIVFTRGRMDVRLSDGEVFYGDKAILSNCQSIAVIKNLFYQITNLAIG
jgi:hypothetical protein